MTHRDKARAQALEYARSQGWRPPEKVHDDEVLRANWRDHDQEHISALSARITELEASLSDSRGEYAPLSGMLEKAEGRIADLREALSELIVAVDAGSSPTLDGKLVDRVREVLS